MLDPGFFSPRVKCSSIFEKLTKSNTFVHYKIKTNETRVQLCGLASYVRRQVGIHLTIVQSTVSLTSKLFYGFSLRPEVQNNIFNRSCVHLLRRFLPIYTRLFDHNFSVHKINPCDIIFLQFDFEAPSG